MLARGRVLIVVVAAIGLTGATTSAIFVHPLGLFRPAAARVIQAADSEATQPDFAPTPEPTPDLIQASSAPYNVYGYTQTMSPAVAGFPERVYVPDSGGNALVIIDPTTYRVVARYYVGAIPQHVAPSWDMQQLYVDDEGSWQLTVIDPRSGAPAGRIPVPDPYNLYFTPDGTKAIVVAERLHRLDFRDPHTFKLIRSVPIPWPGIDHLDFSADGTYLLAGTEYAGTVVRVDTLAMQITGFVHLGGLPVDVRLSPDGSVFYIANQGRNGVSIVDPLELKEIAFIKTGRGAHGLAVSRDTRFLYVANRLAGSISVIEFATRSVVGTWQIGGSPDMIQVSPDGSELWTSGRFSGAVYVVDTQTGKLTHVIRVGGQPHGLSFFPNDGRYSIGHNGVYR